MSVKGQPSPLLSGPLPQRIKADDCYWTLEGGGLVLYVTKEDGMEWWPSVVEGEPGIDITKVRGLGMLTKGIVVVVVVDGGRAN